MKKIHNNVLLALAFLMAISGIPVSFASQANAATNDYVTVTKNVYPTTITTEQDAEVTLNIMGTPPVNEVMPNDVILIIDKSGSMGVNYGPNNGEDKMKAAKDAAKGFIDLMDFSKHQVGVVDFSSENVTHTFPLTTDAAAAKKYIDGISANGGTATGYAIDQAITLLSNHRPEAHPVIVIMTDGEANIPSQNAYEYALQNSQAAKDAGVVFYTIALLSPNDNPDTSGPNVLLKEMATTEQHHHFVLGTVGLSEIYANIVKEIGIASAYNVVVTDIVSPDFDIVPGSYDNNIPKPTVSGNTLTWNFQELKDNNLVFKYRIKPKDPNKSGSLPVSTSSSMITYLDYAGASRSKLIPNANLNVTFPAPVITSIVKDSGHPNGGETVTINGSKFRSGATVTFGSNNASNVQFISGEQITATVPSGIQGIVTVTVTNPDNQKATTNYRYTANPIVTQISPNNGPLVGGTIVTFSGNYFMNGIQVKFGGVNAPMYMYSGSSTYIKVIAPAATTAGAVDVELDNPDGTSLIIPSGYTYNAPPVDVLTVSTVSPNNGLISGGDIVYIDGKKFATGVKVYFGNDEAIVSTYYSDLRLKVVSPQVQNPGVVDVRVVNPNGETATLTHGFTYNPLPDLPAPQITSLSPNSGAISGGDVIYINGTNFVNGLKLYFGSTEVPVTTFYSSSRLKVISPTAPAGLVDVKVVNPDGKEYTLVGGYTFIAPPPPAAPLVTQLTPNSGSTKGGEIIYIDGQNFVNGLKVYFGTTVATVNTFYSSLRIKVTAPASTLDGLVDIRIVNPDGQEGNLTGGYTYIAPPPVPAPQINSLTPNKGTTSGGELITISGANFQQGATVTFGSTTVNLNTYTSASTVKVIAPLSTSTGAVDVKITNPDGQSFTLLQGYTYELPIPTITGLSPNHGPLGGGTVVYVDGTNFEPNMTIKLNGQLVPISTYYGSTRIKFITPSSTVSGSLPLVFTLSSGGTATTSFLYDAPPPVLAPTITKLSAISGTIAGGEILYIDGTGFAAGLKIYFGSTEGGLLTYYSDLRIKVRVPAGNLGFVGVKIVNPDGQTSNIVQYEYK